MRLRHAATVTCSAVAQQLFVARPAHSQALSSRCAIRLVAAQANSDESKTVIAFYVLTALGGLTAGTC